MKRTLLKLVCSLVCMMLCISLEGQTTTTFRYTSTEKIERFEEYSYFVGSTSVISHDYDEESGEGVVVYEGEVTELNSYCLQFTYALKSIVIPEGVTTIRYHAFYECTNMTTISLPKTLTTVTGNAFDSCSSLKDGKLIVDDLAWWCSISFGGVYDNPLFYAKHLYSDEETEITNLVIPEGITNIPNYAFYRCEGITSVSFPTTLKSIGTGAFSYSGLTSVEIPEGFETISESAFGNCSVLKTVTIHEGVSTIGANAFSHCGLTELTLPSTIRIMSQSFYGNEDLTTLTLTNGITTLGHSFYGCTSLASVNIPGSIKEVSSYDFSGCSGLATVTLNEGTEKVEFSGCTNLETINFPSSIKEVSITKNEKLETVTLQEGVERISSFNFCSALKQINIPSTVTYIGTFRDCNALEKVIVADVASWCSARHYDGTIYGPQKMAGKLYLGTVDANEEITNLVIPEGVTKICSGAFSYVDGITSIILPSTLTTMEYKTFYNCSNVTDVYSIANPVSLSWSESENNFMAEKETQMHVVDADLWTSKFPDANATFVGDLTDVGYTATASVSAFRTDNFPGTTAILGNLYDPETSEGHAYFVGNATSVGANAFAGNTALTSIDLPDGITTIGSNAFTGCTGLTTISLPITVTTFDSNAFAGVDNMTDVWYVGEASDLTWDGIGFSPDKGTQMHVMIASDWEESFPDANVTFVGDMTRFRYVSTGKDTESFYDLSKFTGATDLVSHDYDSETGEGSVIFKGIVTALAPNTFYQNKLLTSLTIPSSVIGLGNDCFAQCSNLTTVNLPNTITSLGNWLFYRCSSLTTVNIPTSESLTRLPEYTFCYCTSLSDITIPDNITSIGWSVFSNCTSLTSIYIPSSVTTIESNGFSDCTALEKVITPDIAAWCSISYPGNNATSNPLSYAHHLYLGSKESNSELTDVVVPAGLGEIKAFTFYGFTSMTSISLPESVKKIGNNAFHDCTGLTEVVLPEGFEELGYNVFDGSTSLATLTLPSTLTKIGYYSFMDVPLLTDVYCNAAPTTLSWQNNSNQFIADKGTYFHVAHPAAWIGTFPDANVTYIGELTLSENADNSEELEENDGLLCNVQLTRSLRSGSYNTFAVPFDVSSEQLAMVLGEGVKLKELTTSSFSEGTLGLTFSNATAIEAGKPYLVMVESNVENPTFSGVTVSWTPSPIETAAIDFVPSFGKTLVVGSFGNEDDVNSVLFVGAGNSLAHPTVVNDSEDVNSYIKGFRGYFQLHDSGETAKFFNIDFGDEESTGIVTLESTKDIDGIWFTLDGRQISGKPINKGVYINNGKKVYVK